MIGGSTGDAYGTGKRIAAAIRESAPRATVREHAFEPTLMRVCCTCFKPESSHWPPAPDTPEKP